MNTTQEKKIITREEWDKAVANNAGSSYGLVVMFVVLTIWEAGAQTREEAEKIILDLKLGLSGFQAENAINLALSGDATSWLDKDMMEVKKKEI